MKKLVEVLVLREAGVGEALHGMSMSYGKHDGTRFQRVAGQPILAMLPEVCTAMTDRAGKLAGMQGGHNKFLESILMWLDVRAPRYWWQQADTYRIATKQSESTMHTITKRRLTQDDFVESLPDGWLDELNRHVREKNLDRVKRLLPEGFMQRRVWMMSYKEFQHMWLQRRAHKLEEWRQFLHQVLAQLEYPDYVVTALAEQHEEAAG